MMIENILRYFSASACSFALLSVPLPGMAQEEPALSSALTLRGFGTLGLARSTSGQAEFARDLLQPRGVSDHWSGKIDSNVGLQANFLASNTLEAVVQAVSRYNYRGNFAPELTEVLLKYDPSPYLSLRAGRVGTDFFMHGDSRLIGYSQLVARPNIDFFSSLAVSYLDGVDVQLTTPLGEGLLRGKGYYGFLGEKLPFADGYLNLRGSRAAGAYLDFQTGGWQWRGGMARINFKHSMPDPVVDFQAVLRASGPPSAQKAADDLELQGTYARYYSAGVAYDHGPFMAQLMLSRLGYESKGIQDQDSGMFLAGYRIGEFKPFIGYSQIRSHAAHVSSGMTNTGSGEAINAALASVLAESHAHQKTYTAGVRWDVRRDMALKFQADLIRGHSDSIYTFREETARWNGKTNVFTITMDFVF